MSEPTASDNLDTLANGDGKWGRWRAIQAWELTIEMPLVVLAVVIEIALGNQFVVDSITKLQPVIDIYLMGRYAVLGVHVWKGSQERQLAMQYREDTPTNSRED